MGQPAARISDMHTCPMFNGPVPHVGGPISAGAPTVLIGGLPAARVGDMAVCVGPPDVIVKGSATVLIAGMPAARMGDSTAHGGVIVLGCPTVLIGDAGGGSGIGGMAISRLANGDIQLGNAITIQGTPEFQSEVANRLALIATTNNGKQMLNGVNSSGKSMSIKEFTGNNSFCGPNNSNFQDATASGQPVYNGAGQPINSLFGLGSQQVGTGNGADVTVQFNPKLRLSNSSDPSNPMPNDAILFHEMEHGSHQMNGTYDGSPLPAWTTAEEQTTISTGTPSEAGYLKERGYPWQRTSHGLTYDPNP